MLLELHHRTFCPLGSSLPALATAQGGLAPDLGFGLLSGEGAETVQHLLLPTEEALLDLCPCSFPASWQWPVPWTP